MGGPEGGSLPDTDLTRHPRLDPRRLDEVALSAWPAREQLMYDGWVLRFSAGYTKRANSVNALDASTRPLADKIAHCEAAYRARGLPPIFRLTEASPERTALDAALASRGYRIVEPSLVMSHELDRPIEPPSNDPTNSLAAWASQYARLADRQADVDRHLAILSAMPGRVLALTARDLSERPVACGLGVVYEGMVGLFDLITAPEARRQGHATRLMRDLLAWAWASEARAAYLQVVESNAPARRLYESLGFGPAYRYWYRVGELA